MLILSWSVNAPKLFRTRMRFFLRYEREFCLAPPERMIGGPGLTGYPRSVTLSWPFGSSKALCHDNTTGAVRMFAEALGNSSPKTVAKRYPTAAPGKLGRFMCGLASRSIVKALRPARS
jgi:hypothetical protein